MENTIQQTLETARIDKMRKDYVQIFNKLNALCKEEAGQDIFEFLKSYDVLTEDGFSNVYKLIYK